MKSWLIAPLSGLLLAIGSASAHALSFSSPESSIDPPIKTDFKPPKLALPPIPGFDVNNIPGGTDPSFAITSLVVAYTATSVTGPTSFFNKASNSNEFGLKRDLNLSVDGPGTDLDADESKFGFLNPVVSTPLIAPGETFVAPKTTQNGVVTKVINCPSVDGCLVTDPLFAPYFVPNGPLKFFVSTDTEDTITGGGGNVAIDTQTLAGLKVQLTLNYFGPSGDTKVPEPSSLLGLGLFGLGLGSTVLRKKKKA